MDIKIDNNFFESYLVTFCKEKITILDKLRIFTNLEIQECIGGSNFL